VGISRAFHPVPSERWRQSPQVIGAQDKTETLPALTLIEALEGVGMGTGKGGLGDPRFVVSSPAGSWALLEVLVDRII